MLRRIKAQHLEVPGNTGFYIQIVVDNKTSNLDVFMSIADLNSVEPGDDIHLTYEDGTVYLLKNILSKKISEWIIVAESERMITRLEAAVLEASHDK